MDLSTEVISLFLAMWGAVLSTWLAIRGWIKGRTRIGLDIHHNLRTSDDSRSWQWLAFDITIRNASEKPVSIVEYGLSIIRKDGTVASGNVAHYSEMPNGDTILEDPESQTRSAIDVHLTFLDTPVNLPPRGSATGWIAFYFAEPVAREDAETNPLQLVVVDHERKTWVQTYEGMGGSRPYRSGRTIIMKGR
jgi:hypothetical protein